MIREMRVYKTDPSCQIGSYYHGLRRVVAGTAGESTYALQTGWPILRESEGWGREDATAIGLLLLRCTLGTGWPILRHREG